MQWLEAGMLLEGASSASRTWGLGPAVDCSFQLWVYLPKLGPQRGMTVPTVKALYKKTQARPGFFGWSQADSNR